MLIDKISLRNFRVFHGSHELTLSINPEKHVSVISGQNGFGKTSLLTSLLWGLYGKHLGDVDERYRKEIHDTGGYKKYAAKLMNRLALQNANEENAILITALEQCTLLSEKETIKTKMSDLNSFSVNISLTSLSIPHLTCQNVSVKRIYHVPTGNEVVEILIDGKVNELTKNIGTEIFINDFILPKEIAKFFFFDAEKITALAEIKSLEEKHYFSRAYTEVLGIKKYADLKLNLENMQLKIKKKSAHKADRTKIEAFQIKLAENVSLLEIYQNNYSKKEQELVMKKSDLTEIQERLVRSGSTMNFDELQEFKRIRNQLKEEIAKNKNRFNEMLDLAPFAMVANKLLKVKQQLLLEERQTHHNLIKNLMQEKYKQLLRAFEGKSVENIVQIKQVLATNLLNEIDPNYHILLNYNQEQFSQFSAVLENLGDVYSKQFKTLVSDSRRLLSIYNITQKKVVDAESKENDPVIKALKDTHDTLLQDIKNLEEFILDTKVRIGILEKETSVIKKQLSEQTKYIKIEVSDQQKVETADRLVQQLEIFIHQLKQKKKKSLEKNIHKELNRLMHKSDFIGRVEVKIEGDLVDIELFDSKNMPVTKDTLSKGEQQLYATALLKALITESNTQFPVFIDSPLQKLDKRHASNIIRDFYPTISSQVVVFPLLEKELIEEEYNLLLPKVGKAYLIQQDSASTSSFEEVIPDKLFRYLGNSQNAYV